MAAAGVVFVLHLIMNYWKEDKGMTRLDPTMSSRFYHAPHPPNMATFQTEYPSLNTPVWYEDGGGTVTGYNPMLAYLLFAWLFVCGLFGLAAVFIPLHAFRLRNLVARLRQKVAEKDKEIDRLNQIIRELSPSKPATSASAQEMDDLATATKVPLPDSPPPSPQPAKAAFHASNPAVAVDDSSRPSLADSKRTDAEGSQETVAQPAEVNVTAEEATPDTAETDHADDTPAQGPDDTKSNAAGEESEGSEEPSQPTETLGEPKKKRKRRHRRAKRALKPEGNDQAAGDGKTKNAPSTPVDEARPSQSKTSDIGDKKPSTEQATKSPRPSPAPQTQPTSSSGRLPQAQASQQASLSAWNNFAATSAQEEAERKQQAAQQRASRLAEEARTGVHHQPQLPTYKGTWKQVKVDENGRRVVKVVKDDDPEDSKSDAGDKDE